MWVHLPVCGLVATNVGSVALIVGLGGIRVVQNVGRNMPMFAAQSLDDCGPLQLSQSSGKFLWALYGNRMQKPSWVKCRSFVRTSVRLSRRITCMEMQSVRLYSLSGRAS